MQYDTLPGIDKPISRIVQGTTMVNSRELAKSFALLDAVFELGCTAFDTAHGYGGGDCERTVGRWINERGLRDKVVIIGKGAHHNQDRKRVTPFDITSDLHDSLARFKTNYIDLYLLHRDDPSVPVGPLVEILHEHQRAGLIHAYGGSNWSHQRLQEANVYAVAHGLRPFVASSPHFSLAKQVKVPWADCVSISGPQGTAARKWYREHNMPLFTWASLAGGFFSGRFWRDNLDTFETYHDKLCLDCYCYEENFQRLDRVKILAEQRGMSIPQIATAYVMNYPLNIFALIGSASAHEFKANLAALALELSPQEMTWLDLETD